MNRSVLFVVLCSRLVGQPPTTSTLPPTVGEILTGIGPRILHLDVSAIGDPQRGLYLYGYGYDSARREFLQTPCIVTPQTSRDLIRATGEPIEDRAKWHITNSASDMFTAISGSVDFSGAVGLSSGSGSYAFSREVTTSSSHESLLGSARIIFPAIGLRLIAPTAAATAYDASRFRQYCGDFFIYAIQHGASYRVKYSYDASSYKEKTSRSAAIKAAHGALSGGAQGSEQTASSAISSFAQVDQMRTGFAGGELLPRATISDTAEYLRTFTSTAYRRQQSDNPEDRLGVVSLLLIPYSDIPGMQSLSGFRPFEYASIISKLNSLLSRYYGLLYAQAHPWAFEGVNANRLRSDIDSARTELTQFESTLSQCISDETRQQCRSLDLRAGPPPPTPSDSIELTPQEVVNACQGSDGTTLPPIGGQQVSAPRHYDPQNFWVRLRGEWRDAGNRPWYSESRDAWRGQLVGIYTNGTMDQAAWPGYEERKLAGNHAAVRVHLKDVANQGQCLDNHPNADQPLRVVFYEKVHQD